MHSGSHWPLPLDSESHIDAGQPSSSTVRTEPASRLIAPPSRAAELLSRSNRCPKSTRTEFQACRAPPVDPAALEASVDTGFDPLFRKRMTTRAEIAPPSRELVQPSTVTGPSVGTNRISVTRAPTGTSLHTRVANKLYAFSAYDCRTDLLAPETRVLITT
jgi:hypothetical protein